MIKYDIKEVCPVPPPYGGVSSYIKRLIRQLTIDGYSVGAYYTSECKEKAVIHSPLFDLWSGYSIYKFPWKIFKFLKQVSKYRIIHSHYGLYEMIYLYFALLFQKKAILITVHNSMVKNQYKNLDFISKLFLHKMLRHKKVTWITVSPDGKDQLENLPVKSPNPIYVIPAYVPLSYQETLSLPNAMQLYIHHYKKIITFYGHSFMGNNGEDVYGFKTAIELYALIAEKYGNEIGLIFCLSDASEKDKIENLVKYAQDKNIADKIFWQFGPIKNMSSLWNKTDVYIRPSSTDGDSVAIREVIEFGKPIVASNVCKRPEGCIIYEYGNITDFLEKVERALKIGPQKRQINMEPYNAMKDLYKKVLKTNIRL